MRLSPVHLIANLDILRRFRSATQLHQGKQRNPEENTVLVCFDKLDPTRFKDDDLTLYRKRPGKEPPPRPPGTPDSYRFRNIQHRHFGTLYHYVLTCMTSSSPYDMSHL